MTDTLTTGAATQVKTATVPKPQWEREVRGEYQRSSSIELEQMGLQELLDLDERINKLLREKLKARLQDFMK